MYKRLALSLVVAACLLAVLGSSPGCAPRGKSNARSSLTASSEALVATPAVPSEADTTSSVPTSGSPPVTFAIIGDFGVDDASEQAVATLIASHKPSFVITTGDNYYDEAGGSGTARYDRAVGAYFGGWLKDIHTSGSRYPVGGAAVNSFFPTLGNHDYRDAGGPESYLSYFDLPGAGHTNTSGNERFYDFVEGPVHFFVLNSNPQEPAGTTPASMQGQWLRQQLAASRSPWNVVYFHHPPYSSAAMHGSTVGMQWPFAEWGADVVISGHVHTYERVNRDGIVYLVNGVGGERPLYLFAAPVAGSQVRYNTEVGAQVATATDTTLDFSFITIKGEVVDTYRLTATPPPAK